MVSGAVLYVTSAHPVRTPVRVYPAPSDPARYVDCDIMVAEVRETSRKPDEMYSLLERLSPGTLKLDRDICTQAQPQAGLGGAGQPAAQLRERFRARYGFDPNANENCQVK